MGKKASRYVHGEPTGKRPLIDLNVLPANEPEENLPSPPRLCVSLSFTNVDLEVLRHTYKFQDSSPVVRNEHLRNLGFLEGETDTYMCIRDRKEPSTGKTLKENGDEEAKKYSPEHIEQVKAPKASARMARPRRPKIPKQVCGLAAPRSGIYKSAPKTVRCISPPRSGKEKSAPQAKGLHDIVDAIELQHGDM